MRNILIAAASLAAIVALPAEALALKRSTAVGVGVGAVGGAVVGGPVGAVVGGAAGGYVGNRYYGGRRHVNRRQHRR